MATVRLSKALAMRASIGSLSAPCARVAAREVAAATPATDMMRDEYGDMDSSGETYTFLGDFPLESGGALRDAEVRYRTWGTMNAAKNNILVVCHALTGNASLDTWWGGLLGPGKAFDTNKYLVVCANVLGSCYGTTGPTSVNPLTGEKYGSDFPKVTIRDTVRLHMSMLREGLGVKGVHCAVGGSLGGMQVLEWLLCGAPDFVHSGFAIGCGAQHTAWQIAISETQRQAILSTPEDPARGLAVARMIAMVSYRTQMAYDRKFGRDKQDGKGDKWKVQSYLEYQGAKFLSRFDPESFVALTKLMDTHDVGRGRGGIKAALESIAQPTMILGITSDVLYPLAEQQELAECIPNAQFGRIESSEGHDGFLLEEDQVSEAAVTFLRSVEQTCRL